MLQPALTVVTVLISAVTAAFVTLAVEYFAKPRLEVRKDRIMETQRTWRNLDVQTRALFGTTALTDAIHWEIPWEQMYERLRELRDQLQLCEQTALELGPGKLLWLSRGVPVYNYLRFYRKFVDDLLAASTSTEFDLDKNAVPRTLKALHHDLEILLPTIRKRRHVNRYGGRIPREYRYDPFSLHPPKLLDVKEVRRLNTYLTARPTDPNERASRQARASE